MPVTRRNKHAPLTSKKQCCGKLSGAGAAPVRLQQYPLDDVDVDIACAQVFECGHGIAAVLDRNAGIDDAALARVGPGFVYDCRYIRLLAWGLLHSDLASQVEVS